MAGPSRRRRSRLAEQRAEIAAILEWVEENDPNGERFIQWIWQASRRKRYREEQLARERTARLVRWEQRRRCDDAPQTDPGGPLRIVARERMRNFDRNFVRVTFNREVSREEVIKEVIRPNALGGTILRLGVHRQGAKWPGLHFAEVEIYTK